MPKSNIHILAKDELEYFNGKYEFSIKDDAIVVKIKDYDRATVHPLNQKFSLKTIIRKLTISVEALNLWSNNFYKKVKDYKTGQDLYSLIDIQNAINKLIVSYQDITFESVLDVLKHSN